MKNKLICSSLMILFMMFFTSNTFGQLAASHESNGIFKLSTGNEIRFKLNSLKSERITGILVSDQGVRLASFSGKISRQNRSIEGDLTYCEGSKGKLTWYFERNTDDTAQVYLQIGKSEIKAIATRTKKGVPDLSLACPVSSLAQNTKANWTGTWNSSFGELRLVQLTMSNPNQTKVIGDYSNLGHIDANLKNGKWEGLFNNGNREGQVSFVLSEDGKTFSDTWKFDGETQWKTWSGTKSSAPKPVITHRSATLIIDRINRENNETSRN